jgi:hypothetical protein
MTATVFAFALLTTHYVLVEEIDTSSEIIESSETSIDSLAYLVHHLEG